LRYREGERDLREQLNNIKDEIRRIDSIRPTTQLEYDEKIEQYNGQLFRLRNRPPIMSKGLMDG